jgi:predicted aminopeptidase
MRRRALLSVAAVTLTIGVFSLRPVRWLFAQAWGQARLLAGRIPLNEAREDPRLQPVERERLDLVPRVKAFGEGTLGLLATANYGTVNLDFDDVVWNVSACAADRFEPHRYHYPIVGTLPYTGFFDRRDAEEEARRLREAGLDTWVREAGAYSSLGWFRDPLWRSMLRWDEGQLANTILHELAHATVWLPDHGTWNESFASFVGDHGAELFLQSIAAERPDALRRYRDQAEDRARSTKELHALAQKLDAVYSSGAPRAEVLQQKRQILDDERSRWRSLPWRLPGYAALFDDPSLWNNARLYQFRLYSSVSDEFAAALSHFGGDLAAFVARAGEELPGASRKGGASWDPFIATAALHPVAE